MKKMDRRNFIGMISSLFAFAFSTKSKASPKPLYSISEYGRGILDDRSILRLGFSEFEVIEESVIIDNDRGRYDNNGGNFKWIWVRLNNIDGMFVHLSGCTEEEVQYAINLAKKEYKKLYVYRLYNEDGKLLNYVTTESPILI